MNHSVQLIIPNTLNQSNKLDCIKELSDRIIKLNYKPKIRIKTKPTRSSIEKRLKYKKQQSEKKKNVSVLKQVK